MVRPQEACSLQLGAWTTEVLECGRRAKREDRLRTECCEMYVLHLVIFLYAISIKEGARQRCDYSTLEYK